MVRREMIDFVYDQFKGGSEAGITRAMQANWLTSKVMREWLGNKSLSYDISTNIDLRWKGTSHII